MRIIHRLITASCGIHSADQASIVAVPIVASALFDASPEAIGVLVAAQSIAHLLGSIPFGLIVDKLPLKSAALLATIISFLAFCGVAVGVIYGSLLMFGITILVSSFGIVLYSLVVLSIVPIISKTDQLSETNARLEIPRSLAAFVIPLTIGVVAVQDASAVIFGLAAISALIAVMAIVQLPELPAFTRPKGSSFQLILEAGQYIFKHDLLRPITACALFWNVAFAALLVVLIPFMAEQYNANPNTFGLALAAFGAGGILGSWSISRFSKSVTPNFILLYGPGSSAAAISLLIFPQFFDVNIIYVGFFFLGLGPSMWLIVQNSIRQLATPNQMLGRVNSVIQTAIYGIRPVGALIGGFIAGTLSPSHGMTFVIVMMVCSFAAAVFSRLRNISSLSHVLVLSSRLA